MSAEETPVAESWEDTAEATPEAAPEAAPAAPVAEKPKMNPFASSFNPNAGAFVPSWMKKDTPAAPAADAATVEPTPVAAAPVAEAAAPVAPAAADAPKKGKTLAEVEAEELAKIEAAESAAQKEVVEPVLSKKFQPPEMSEAEKEKKKLKLVNIVFIGDLCRAVCCCSISNEHLVKFRSRFAGCRSSVICVRRPCRCW